MKCEIIAIGRELLMGEITDTNSPFIAQELAKADITVSKISQVGDNLADLVHSFKVALDNADMVVACGGLGPTSDDLTRESAATLFNEKPYVDTALLQWLKGVFTKRGIPNMPKSNVKQAWLIQSATPLHNPIGTAPGWWIQKDGKVMVLVPGPPRELQSMWHTSVNQKLQTISTGQKIAVRTIKTFGMTEGDVDQVLSDLFGKENPYLGIYARRDGIHLRTIARAESIQEAERILNEVICEIQLRIPKSIWGYDEDLPATSLARLIQQKGITLAAAEGASAGCVSSMMQEAKASNNFLGSLVVNSVNLTKQLDILEPLLNSDIKRHITLNTYNGDKESNLAVSMAFMAKQMFGADVGLSTTPASVSELQTPIYVGMVSQKGVRVIRNSFVRGRVYLNERTALFALVEAVGWLEND